MTSCVSLRRTTYWPIPGNKHFSDYPGLIEHFAETVHCISIRWVECSILDNEKLDPDDFFLHPGDNQMLDKSPKHHDGDAYPPTLPKCELSPTELDIVLYDYKESFAAEVEAERLKVGEAVVRKKWNASRRHDSYKRMKANEEFYWSGEGTP